MFPRLPSAPPRTAARAGTDHGTGDRLGRRDREAEWAVVQRIVAHAVCAANPCGGSIFAIRVPIVLMIRQPPAYVPRAMASAAETITQRRRTAEVRLELAGRDQRERR